MKKYTIPTLGSVAILFALITIGTLAYIASESEPATYSQYSYSKNGIYFENTLIFSGNIQESGIYHSGIFLAYDGAVFILGNKVDNIRNITELNNLYDNILFHDTTGAIYFLWHAIPDLGLDAINSDLIGSDKWFIGLDKVEPVFIDKQGFLYSLSGKIKEYRYEDITQLKQKDCLAVAFTDETIFAHKFIYGKSVQGFYAEDEVSLDEVCKLLLFL